MRLLILGGNVFLGRAVARYARDAGHRVTCLARGSSGAPVDGVRFLPVDRDRPDALSVVDGEHFDAVVDVTRRPSHARRAAAALADRVGHWVYVSTISVYADTATVGQRADTAPLLDPAPPGVDDPGTDPETYGTCKVACEQAVIETVGAARSLLARAGLIVGPGDLSSRFSYWVERLARGGRVLAPGRPTDPVQAVDVRDLAAWLVDAGERGLAGAYNATSAPMARAQMLEQIATGVGTTPEFVWADEEFLRAHEVRPWAGERSLPLWAPTSHAGVLGHDPGPALAAGLSPRPVAETAAATLDWLGRHPDEREPAGLTAAEEAQLLRAWDETGAGTGRTVTS